MLVFKNLNSFPSAVEGFCNNEQPFSWNRNWATISTPAVNIVDDKDEFRIEVAAPGLNKDDFKINLENNELTISANKEIKNEEKNETFTHKEFGYSSFTRSFTLPETVHGEKISAGHKDGILTIHIPKKEEAKPKPAREIAVA